LAAKTAEGAFMAKRDEYYFGAVLKEIDYYAFPRTGSHFLHYCMSGLFDLVTRLPEDIRKNPEAASRQNELRAEALYALELREPGAAFAPLWVNTMTNGLHSMPRPGENPILILIRHPLAAAYSAWSTRKRLGFEIETQEQLAKHLDWYEKFYDTAMQLTKSNDTQALLIRYEKLISTVATLELIAAFVDIRPKLSPQFVYWITQFDNFVAQGKRTFYQTGDDTAWRQSEGFLELLASAGPPRDFRRFGYESEHARMIHPAGMPR
jgi:hypothetical protein